MPPKLLPILLFATLSSSLAAPQLKVVNAFVEATPPGVEVGGAYLTLVNPTDQPIKLLGGSTPIAGRVTPMKNVTVKGGMPGMKGMASMDMTGMKGVKFMTVPAHGQLVLEPGGDHLMLYGLKRTPRAGESVTLTLNFEPGGALTLKLPVKRL